MIPAAQFLCLFLINSVVEIVCSHKYVKGVTLLIQGKDFTPELQKVGVLKNVLKPTVFHHTSIKLSWKSSVSLVLEAASLLNGEKVH
jgi:hypothetical protein